jgi:hypothetical protein
LLRYLEAKIVLLNKRLREKKLPNESIPPISSQVDKNNSSSESEHEETEEIDPDDMSVSGSEGDEEELDGTENEEDQGEEDDMEQFLDEIDLAEERRLTELENPTAKGQVPIGPPTELLIP